MNHIKTILFLLVSLAVGVGIGKAYNYWRAHPDADFTHHGEAPVVTGIGNAPASRGFTVATLSDLPRALDVARRSFATSIGIEYSAAITPDALKKAVEDIHAEGMHAILLPPPIFASRTPYAAPLAQVAADAQTAQCDDLCISWLNSPADADYWLAQSAAARNAFSGKLIFAATPDVLTGISCWDAADILAAIGPVALPRRLPHAADDLTDHDLRVAWDCSLSGLEYLARAHEKKLALLHMNVPLEVSGKLPAPGTPDAPAANAPLQEKLYEALLLETKGRSVNTSMLLFNWGSDAACPNNLPGLLGKVAEAWNPDGPSDGEKSAGTSSAAASNQVAAGK